MEYSVNGWIKSMPSPVGFINTLTVKDGSIIVVTGKEGIALLENGTWSYINQQNTGLKDKHLLQVDLVTGNWSSVQSSSLRAEDAFFISRMCMDGNKNIWFYCGLKSLCIYNENGIR